MEVSYLNLLRQRVEEERLPLRVVLKEVLQIYSLQGGTCLRLVYGASGAPRADPFRGDDANSIQGYRGAEMENLRASVDNDVAAASNGGVVMSEPLRKPSRATRR